ncbi:MAG TPA: hypothetical protein VFP84_23495 [Kofleriaceae bacterium]|nr:hypothetical protein [Kofleriaceae bacterium]
MIGWLDAWRKRSPKLGGGDLDDARRLADAERAAGDVPDGCAWLDDRTVSDVDLPLVFRAVDRTSTPLGAQALWRWLVAPAQRLDVLARRERRLAALADPALRDRVHAAIAGQTANEAPLLPRLLWEPTRPPPRRLGFAVLALALIGCAIASALVAPPLLVAVIVLFGVNVVVDDWTGRRLAAQGHAIEALVRRLAAIDRALRLAEVHDPAIARDLAAFARLRKRTLWLSIRDPFAIADLVRAGLLVRVLLLGSFLHQIARERARLQRLVLWLGELDAVASVAIVRTERADARVPRLEAGARRIAATELVHPAVVDAVGNDLAIARGLIITGSNMSGKSTFLRAIAINAICAQALHTTFGAWHAGLFRVFAVMRIADATEAGASTYATEVAATGALVAAAEISSPPALFVIDEPFRGTSPTLRVPIVVATLDFLSRDHLAVAATHDLEVAAQVDAAFLRGYFCEPDDAAAGEFDHKLRTGVSPASNALQLLIRAGYPAALIAAVRDRMA